MNKLWKNSVAVGAIVGVIAGLLRAIYVVLYNIGHVDFGGLILTLLKASLQGTVWGLATTLGVAIIIFVVGFVPYMIWSGVKNKA